MEMDIREQVLLRRVGTLAHGGEFTCLVAQWYSYNRIFTDRARQAPDNIDILIIKSVSSMSATRLMGFMPSWKFSEGGSLSAPIQRSHVSPVAIHKHYHPGTKHESNSKWRRSRWQASFLH